MKKLPESPFKFTPEKYQRLDEYSENLEAEFIRLRDENSELRRINGESHKHNKVLVKKVENLSNENTFLKNGHYGLELIKQLESENSELKKQLIHLSEQQTERIQRAVNDKQYIMKLEAELESLKERIELDTRLIVKVQQDRKEFFEDLKCAEKALDEAREEVLKLITENSNLKTYINSLGEENNRILEELEASRQASECFRNFLKLGKE